MPSSSTNRARWSGRRRPCVLATPSRCSWPAVASTPKSRRRRSRPVEFSYATTPDYDFVTDRLAVGGSIFTRENFEALMRAGFTHIINTQIEFDDQTLSRGTDHEPAILWLPTDDDFLPKPFEFFDRGVRYALDVLDQPESKLL